MENVHSCRGVETLLRLIKDYDDYTYKHSLRVAKYMNEFGKLHGMKLKKRKDLYVGGLLHDIGKIFISKNIIKKEDKLTDEEYDVIKRHPIKGLQFLADFDNFQDMNDITNIVMSHHERINGSGYPFGLKGEEIPYSVRLAGIVDSFDAMISDRTYKKSKSVEESLKDLSINSNVLYDGDLVERFKWAINKGKIPVIS